MKYSLKECIDKIIDNRGKNPNQYCFDEKYPVLDNYLIKNDIYPNLKEVKRFIDENTFNTFIRNYLGKNDVIMTLVGNGIGNVSMSPSDKVVIIQNTIGFRTKQGILLNKFLYYYFKYINRELLNFNRGSSQPSIKKTDILDMTIDIPTIDKQKAIVEILFTIDMKIQNNNKINEKLEEMAQAIFKQWFIDFEFPNEEGDPYKSSGGEMVESDLGMIPKVWEVSNLEGIIEFNPKETLKKDEEYKFIEMAALSNFSSNIQYWIGKKFGSGSKFRNGDTLLARITPCLENGKTAFVDILEEGEVAFGSTEFIVMRANDLSNKYYIYCLAREDNFRAHAIKSMSGSSGRQRVQLDLLKNYKIAKSPQSIYSRFGNLLENLFQKIANNNKETVRLVKLRDELLPKLMSGEIRVPLK
ncbi:restriction endonuclease subunit S [Clostridium botulinum]|uniref:restriction endonuclease subunit S n=1 Tax=Clostridium botulinum TaxID=1491 RepID=UPI0013F10D2F|nr:restriction endonuclease subunit S [Clostridium botulinum]MBN3346142.1 restriction endonuclease [Clostridium botulinum]NFC28023.1 restriction endonuclease subunit S [Clostridium botulinum]NFC61380.1 restriction endonuclease subunit S [Clostridium botulinum]NFC68216.1 restriction endonuclease subunit S [Clostridium botulinum]NFE36940.1 restriction endonuclease subunit S [Clostridium botulinum]